MSLVDDFPAKKGSNMHAFDATFSNFCQIFCLKFKNSVDGVESSKPMKK